jgi:TolA-binding protein
MQEVASSAAMRTTAQLGILRCSYYTDNIAATIEVATRLIEQENLAEEIRQEAIYCRAKSHLKEKQYGLAIVDLTPISKEVRTIIGAEAKYELANCYFQLGAIDMAEQEVMSFMQMQTTQQYWLAKSMILLADINLQRNDTFQAKQYLLALQANYKQTDDIQTIVAEKLAALETTKEETPELEEEDTL